MVKFFVLFFLLLAVVGMASENETTKPEQVKKETLPDDFLATSIRSKNRIGFYAALHSDPYPSKIGLNMGYNLSDLSRFHFGAGMKNEAVLFGWGFSLFVPDWNTSPTIGVNYSGIIGGGEFAGTKDQLYLNAGLDCQLDIGLYIGVGYNHSLTNSDLRTQPYIHIGHFFNP